MRRGLTAISDAVGIAYGGDYNPEQWDPSVWREDIELMRAAGVNLVSVGVFSWAVSEPREGEYELDWLGTVLDLLHEAGIAVDLATPVASPPPWLGHRHPDSLPVTASGETQFWGSRTQFCPSSAVYRSAARGITDAIAARYAGHPAVVMWHAGNEYGQLCHCDQTASAFQDWLRARYGSLDAVNEAWATTVWAQRYSDWSEVIPPRTAPYHRNPALELDFRRFTSDALLKLFNEQRAVIRRHDAERPITTNLMGFFAGVDPVDWRSSLDIVADDAYPDPASASFAADAAFVNALARGLADGPWMRMEQASSAVSWRDHNLTKTAGQSRAEVLQSVAHGCDAVLFFQWRQAAHGPERFHSALLPNAGPDTEVFRGTTRIGRELPFMREVVGERVIAPAALLWDWQSWWAGTQEGLPTRDLDPHFVAADWHRALRANGITADVVDPRHDLSAYALVVVPSLAILEPAVAERLRSYVADGGTLVWGPFSGVMDGHAGLYRGRAPALLADVLGVSSEEYVPLADGRTPLSWSGDVLGDAHTYGERTRADTAEAVAQYASGALAGSVAVGRNRYRRGTAWYVGTLLTSGLPAVLARAAADADISVTRLPEPVEVVVRGRTVFVLNHGHEPTKVPVAEILASTGALAALGEGCPTDLLTGGVVAGERLPLEGWGVAALHAAEPAVRHEQTTR